MKERAQLMERLGTSDVEALIQEYVQGPQSRDRQGLQMLFTAMAERDPEKAWNQAMNGLIISTNSLLQH